MSLTHYTSLKLFKVKFSNVVLWSFMLSLLRSNHYTEYCGFQRNFLAPQNTDIWPDTIERLKFGKKWISQKRVCLFLFLEKKNHFPHHTCEVLHTEVFFILTGQLSLPSSVWPNSQVPRAQRRPISPVITCNVCSSLLPQQQWANTRATPRTGRPCQTPPSPGISRVNSRALPCL